MRVEAAAACHCVKVEEVEEVEEVEHRDCFREEEQRLVEVEVEVEEVALTGLEASSQWSWSKRIRRGELNESCGSLGLGFMVCSRTFNES